MAKRRLLRETVAGTWARMFSQDVTTEGGTWETGTVVIQENEYIVVFANGYFDLSGYTKEQQTLFCQSVAIQENPLLFGNGVCFAAHVVSTQPLNLDDFTVTSPSTAWALPGNMGNHYSMQQIFWGQCTLYTEDTTTNSIRPSTGGTWGTGYSTAGEKLYYAVAYAIPKLVNSNIIIPDTTFVLPSVIDEEPDLEYIMRLKRSYELAE